FLIVFFAVTQEDESNIPSGFDKEAVLNGEYGEHLSDKYPPDIHPDEMEDENLFALDAEREIPEWVKPVRWFRSNKGGMALEEIPSRYAVLRNDYALAIDFIEQDDLPDYLIPYYDKSFYIEIRSLYEKGKQIRVQYIFRDFSGTTRLAAVFLENEAELVNEIETFDEAKIAVEIQEHEDGANIDDIIIANIEVVEKPKQHSGFIEIYNKNAFLTSEYRFFEDGRRNRADYTLNNGLMISSLVWEWEEDETGGGYREAYADYFRYNRALYLRAVERRFFEGGQISPADAMLVTFPYRIMDSTQNVVFISERFNSYPDFFGNISIGKEHKIIFSTDDRGRIMNQTLYDDKDEVIWVIVNSWIDERIISSSKTEGEVTLLAEFEYDADGNRTIERNYRDGKLERRVFTEGKIDTEELYFNDIIVMRAVWEDGRKISETRGRH
ncbi:MAG: hypothetical protein LBU66_07310, partial [Treponema sp.]|nr:hypothetical protein [Treponema sp.]